MCKDPSGGYGNRIHAITMSLLFAILSGRIFLIEMTHPFDIKRLLHRNAINWNYADYIHVNKGGIKDFRLIDQGGLKSSWQSFPRELLANIGIISLKTITFSPMAVLYNICSLMIKQSP